MVLTSPVRQNDGGRGNSFCASLAAGCKNAFAYYSEPFAVMPSEAKHLSSPLTPKPLGPAIHQLPHCEHLKISLDFENAESLRCSSAGRCKRLPADGGIPSGRSLNSSRLSAALPRAGASSGSRAPPEAMQLKLAPSWPRAPHPTAPSARRATLCSLATSPAESSACPPAARS